MDTLYKTCNHKTRSYAKVKLQEVYGFDFKAKPIAIDDGTKFDVDHRPSAGAFYSRITNFLDLEHVKEN